MNRVTVDEQMLVSAVRYALGRQTYIVGWTVNEVVDAWPDLSQGARALIIRDVIEAAPRISDVDRQDWNRVTTLAAHLDDGTAHETR